MQKCRLPSFFRTRTTVLASRLQDFLIAPISSISCKCFFISSNWSGKICLYLSLKGVGLVSYDGVFSYSGLSQIKIIQSKEKPKLSDQIPYFLLFLNWPIDNPNEIHLTEYFFKFLRGKWHNFFKKLNFPKELCLLLVKLETKSLFFFKKSILGEKNIYLILKVTWIPLLVLILYFHFWTDISTDKTTVHTGAPMKSFKTNFFYIQNTVAFLFHSIL